MQSSEPESNRRETDYKADMKPNLYVVDPISGPWNPSIEMNPDIHSHNHARISR